jgi:hypothetical protein
MVQKSAENQSLRHVGARRLGAIARVIKPQLISGIKSVTFWKIEYLDLGRVLALHRWTFIH